MVREAEIRAIHKEYRNFYELIGGSALVGIGILIGYFLFQEDIGYQTNLYTTILGVLLTIFVLDRRAQHRETERLKQDLIYRLGSRVNSEAVRAAEELKRREWLVDGSLVGANLWEANLADAVMWRANLSRAVLHRAQLQRTNLNQSNLKNAELQGANMEQAGLFGANLVGANLDAVNFEGSNLTGANLEGGNLETSNLAGVTLIEANLERAILSTPYHIYVSANKQLGLDAPKRFGRVPQSSDDSRSSPIYRADLRGANMKYTDLRGLDLQFINLHGADLRYARLEGSDLFGSNLTDVLLYGAVMPDGTEYHPQIDLAQFGAFVIHN